MSRRPAARSAALVLLPPLLLVAGCAVTAPRLEPISAASEFAFSGGQGFLDVPAPLGVVLPAVVEAANDLGFRDVKQAHDGAVARIEARSADDRNVAATIRSRPGAVRIAVRVGWFGDEPLSRAFLDRIGVRMGSRPPQALIEPPPSEPSANPYFRRSADSGGELLRDFADSMHRDRLVP